MNVETYHRRRLEAAAREPAPRKFCVGCRQPDFSCFCAWVKPIDPGIDFIILTHPIELKRRRIVSGWMSHVSLINSQVIIDQDYSENEKLNAVLNDPARTCMMLYPGRLSTNLTPMSPADRAALVPRDTRLTLIIIDGTWNTARKTVHLSKNLKGIPRICFTPTTPSNWRIRQQPNAQSYSTIEAIHQTLALLNKPNEGLLEVFNNMVNRQIELAHSGRPSRRKHN